MQIYLEFIMNKSNNYLLYSKLLHVLRNIICDLTIVFLRSENQGTGRRVFALAVRYSSRGFKRKSGASGVESTQVPGHSFKAVWCYL